MKKTLLPVAVVLTLLLPFFLFYGRALAEIDVCLVDVCFLIQAGLNRDWGWTKEKWVWLAAGLWGWQLVASLVNGPVHSVLEGALIIRLFLFTAALEAWVLRGPRARRALWLVLAGLGAWTLIECWQQFLFHHNITGYPRWPDGALTGPFYKPRAGEIFMFVGLSGLMPLVLILLRQKRGQVFGGVAVALLLATMVLIGQRMPNLILLLGLFITALLVKRLRGPLAGALLVGAGTVLLLPHISPATHAKLVTHFAQQMGNFFGSAYGQLYTRAVMVAAHPILGFGFEGFKDFCPDPRYFHEIPGVPAADNGGAEACNLHPHNYYLQIAVMAGLPGLVMFCSMVALWLVKMGRALRPAQNAVQAMLFVVACAMFWPIASTSSMFTFDTAGWIFMFLGFGLAASSDGEFKNK
jgi:O-antigen ligase